MSENDNLTDPDGVIGEFSEMVTAARADRSLDAYRRLHEVAGNRGANGYNQGHGKVVN